ncbi:hypothetical protein BpHYR1_036391 [Brachionus plicatilis]|uniref:Uncharacterized protein n=1 Tax=Brachionus plicatilis TaxID=10195 RepID=A0A3M7SNU4_BRAPC|nr:hypothetical protein BpHYR1_036391 [Brachionus plicatilis]
MGKEIMICGFLHQAKKLSNFSIKKNLQNRPASKNSAHLFVSFLYGFHDKSIMLVDLDSSMKGISLRLKPKKPMFSSNVLSKPPN